MACTLARDLDPLDMEIVERAVQAVSDVIGAGAASAGLETDGTREAALRRELAEMVRASGVSDAEALLDILIEGMREKIGMVPLRGGTLL